MDDWIGEEVARRKEAKESYHLWEKHFEICCAETNALWTELPVRIQNALRKISNTPELQLGAPIEFEIVGKWSFKLSRAKPPTGGPTLDQTVSRSTDSLSITRLAVWSMGIHNEVLDRRLIDDRLQCQVDDNEHPFFRTSKGDLLPSRDDVVRHLLGPFLR